MKKLNFKNLESLKNEKFSISKEEQNQILGGYRVLYTDEIQETCVNGNQDSKQILTDRVYLP